MMTTDGAKQNEEAPIRYISPPNVDHTSCNYNPFPCSQLLGEKAHLIAIDNTINMDYQGKLQRAYKA
jgi:hypothetical protein